MINFLSLLNFSSTSIPLELNLSPEITTALIAAIAGIVATIANVVIAMVNRKKDVDTTRISKSGEVEAIYTNKITDLLETYRKDIEKLNEKVDKLTQKNEELSNTITEQKLKIGELVESNKQLTQKNEELKQSNIRLTTEFEELKSRYNNDNNH